MENKYSKNWLIIGLLTSLVSHIIIELLQNVGFTTNYLSVPLIVLGTAILFIVYTLFSSLFGSSIIGAILLLITAFTLGTINRIKLYYRAEPLYPNEFIIVKEVPFVIEMIGWPVTVLIGLTIITAIILLYRFYKHQEVTMSPTYRLIGVLLSISSLFYISQFHTTDNLVKQMYNTYTEWTYHDQLKSYQDNGFIVGFLSNLPAPPMEEPENYTKEAMAQLVEKYKNKASQINQWKDEPRLDTNIIFVMNESFSDPTNLLGIESNKDPIPNYRKITSNTYSGHVLSPTFGGGTNAIEFQALTGFSLEPLNPQFTSPYMQLDDGIEDYPTIVTKMNRLNYQTTAIHPYDPHFFKRDEVYEKMNFDEFLHQENMKNQEKISDEHLYISDAATYQETFEVLEQSQSTDFIHVVTMQNHTPYADKYSEVDYEVTGSGNKEEANAYFQDLENSDKALKEFMDKIAQHNEPILLVFWGDHLPGLYRGAVRETNSEFTLRQTPYFIFSNRMDIEGVGETISPNYLSQRIFQLLNLNVSSYEVLLIELEERLPIIDKGIYREAKTNRIYSQREDLTDETLEVLEDYTLLMYDVTTGERYAGEMDFFRALK